MSEMVNRAAKAILAKVPVGYGMRADEALGYARAVIETMREPTDDMQADGRDKLMEWLPMGQLRKAAAHQWQPGNEVYQAMIDAALVESLNARKDSE